MDDYDWKVPGDEWTDWSHHEGTGVTEDSIIDLSANFSFFLLSSCYTTGIVSAQVAEPESMDEQNLSKTVVKVVRGYVVVDERGDLFSLILAMACSFTCSKKAMCANNLIS
jgi:hypothetical protein